MTFCPNRFDTDILINGDHFHECNTYIIFDRQSYGYFDHFDDDLTKQSNFNYDDEFPVHMIGDYDFISGDPTVARSKIENFNQFVYPEKIPDTQNKYDCNFDVIVFAIIVLIALYLVATTKITV